MQAAAEYDRETLLIEYSRLFVGPFHLPAPPYGSVYLDEGATVMGNSTIEVVKCYRDAGVEMSDTFNDAPDHISAELEFMRFLCLQQHEAAEAGDDALFRKALSRQRDFIERFLITWVPEFVERVKNSTRNAWYSALADNLSWLIRIDQMSISSLLR